MPTVIDKTPIHDDAIGWSRGAIRYARGEVDPPHHHPQGQLLFATKGVMLVETGSQRWVIPRSAHCGSRLFRNIPTACYPRQSCARCGSAPRLSIAASRLYTGMRFT